MSAFVRGRLSSRSISCEYRKRYAVSGYRPVLAAPVLVASSATVLKSAIAASRRIRILAVRRAARAVTMLETIVGMAAITAPTATESSVHPGEFKLERTLPPRFRARAAAIGLPFHPSSGSEFSKPRKGGRRMSKELLKTSFSVDRELWEAGSDLGARGRDRGSGADRAGVGGLLEEGGEEGGGR